MSTSFPLSSEPEISPGKSYQEINEPVKKLLSSEHKRPIRKGNSSNHRVNKLINSESSSRTNLSRAPSMPTFSIAEHEEIHDEDTEFSMSKLIRQASLNSSTLALPKTKVGTPSSSAAAKHQASKIKLEKEKIIKVDEESEKIISTIPKPQGFKNQLRTQKSLSNLNLEESKRLKDDFVAEKSTDDIKVQIKFWAKAVASNVRQDG